MKIFHTKVIILIYYFVFGWNWVPYKYWRVLIISIEYWLNHSDENGKLDMRIHMLCIIMLLFRVMVFIKRPSIKDETFMIFSSFEDDLWITIALTSVIMATICYLHNSYYKLQPDSQFSLFNACFFVLSSVSQQGKQQLTHFHIHYREFVEQHSNNFPMRWVHH